MKEDLPSLIPVRLCEMTGGVEEMYLWIIVSAANTCQVASLDGAAHLLTL